MNRVVQFDETTMTGEKDLDRLLVEFDAQGHALREIGIGTDGRIIHRHPGKPTLDKYGLMGPNVIEIIGEDTSPQSILMDASNLLPLEAFDALWVSE